MPNGRLMLAGGILAVAGGLLMFLGGVASHSITLWILPTLNQEIVPHLPAAVQAEATISVDVIAGLISLGGITVAAGGVLLLARRKTTGRLLVALGGGAGFIGLLLALGYFVYVNGVGGLYAHAGYWAGVVLAVVGRRLAGKA